MVKITREDCYKGVTGGKELEVSPLSGEFASKAWCRSSLDRLIKTINAGLPVDGVIDRGRRRPVRTAANVARVEELFCSQEDAPDTHKTTTALVCSDKVCCRISQPSAVATGGLCSRTARRRTRLGTPSRTCGVRISPSSNRTCDHRTVRT